MPAVPTIRVEVARVEKMSWREFFEACSTGARLSSVRARLRETEEVEKLIADVDFAATLDTPDVPREALSVLFDIGTKDELADYFAVVRADSGDWTAEQRGLVRAQCSASTESGDVTLGVVPLRSLSAAEALRDTAFRGASSFRVFSPRTTAEIVSMLSASS